MSTNLDPTPITPTTDTTLLSDLCPFCNESPPKYRCPACDARTCSLKCSKRHKAYKQCSGTRDPTAYIKRSKLATPTALNRDFNFLTGVERAVTGGPEVLKENDDEQERGKNAEQKKKQATQTREAWIDKSGVVVKRAPQGMKRSSENRTDVVKTKKARLLHWTVEWILCDEGNKRILDDRVMESSKLTSAFFHPNNRESRKKSKPEMSKTRFYLKKVGTPANRPALIPLNPVAELRDCIRGRTVEEYPTIYVTAREEHPEGFEIDQSIAADAKGKLEVLEETSTDNAVNLEKLEELVAEDFQQKSEELGQSMAAETGRKVEVSDLKAEIISGGRTTIKERDISVQHVDDDTTINGGGLGEQLLPNQEKIGYSREDATVVEEELLQGALLELIGANGVGVEAGGDLLERPNNDESPAECGTETRGAAGSGTDDTREGSET